MDRVAFLIEDEPGTLLECLLNPERLLIRREAGITEIHSVHGRLTGVGRTNTPVFFQGGGVTELELYLLFDVDLQKSQHAFKDVRELTKPLWDLTNSSPADPTRPAVARFIWGKSWNIPGVILNLSENLEHFTPSGIPRRSWLSMRFRQVDMPSTGRKPAKTASLKTVVGDAVKQAQAKVNEAARTHLLTGGSLLPSAAKQLSGNTTTPPSTEGLIQQMLASTGLGEYIQASVQTARALLSDLWGIIADSSLSRTLQNSWQKTQAFLADITRASGAWLLTQYGKMKQVLTTLTGHLSRFVDESVAPFSQAVLQNVKQLLGSIKQQAQSAWQSSRQAFTHLKGAAVKVLGTGANWLYKAAGSVVHMSKQAAQELGEAGSSIYQAIQTALQKTLAGARFIGQKGAEWLVKPLTKQLGKLPALIRRAWRSGKKQAARLGEFLLDASLQGIQHLKAAAGSLRLSAHHAPGKQAQSCVNTLQTGLASPTDAQDDALIQEQLGQLADNIGQLPASEEQTALQNSLKALQAVLQTGKDTTPPASGPSPSTLLSDMQGQLDQLEGRQAQQDQAELEETVLNSETRAGQIKSVTPGNTERLDQLAFKYYGDASLWRRLAYANDIIDPLRLPGNLALKIPAGGAP